MLSLHDTWLNQLSQVERDGQLIGPRGYLTSEVLATRFDVDSMSSLLDVAQRKLNFRFAVAEWIWMMFGHAAVGPIAQYNSIMKNFSDDGVWLTGAYGPHICAQQWKILRKLTDDPDTRQAVIDIPRPPVYTTKDEPCTLSLQYLLRDGRLNCIATMRSSDMWLGIPYDVYTFSMIQNCFAGVLGVPRGWLRVNSGSLHLYRRDAKAAMQCVFGDGHKQTINVPDVPGLPPAWLENVMLKRNASAIPPLMDSSPWLPYAHVLLSQTSEQAREILIAVSGRVP